MTQSQAIAVAKRLAHSLGVAFAVVPKGPDWQVVTAIGRDRGATLVVDPPAGSGPIGSGTHGRFQAEASARVE